jgi:hypothetical protein
MKWFDDFFIILKEYYKADRNPVARAVSLIVLLQGLNILTVVFFINEVYPSTKYVDDFSCVVIIWLFSITVNNIKYSIYYDEKNEELHDEKSIVQKRFVVYLILTIVLILGVASFCRIHQGKSIFAEPKLKL